jgi:hypothetical protein
LRSVPPSLYLWLIHRLLFHHGLFHQALLDQGLFDHDLADHAGLAMAGDQARIFERAGLGELPRDLGRFLFRKTRSETGGEGFAIAGRSAAIAETHNMA